MANHESSKMIPRTAKDVCFAIAVALMIVGAVGLFLGFVFLTSSSPVEVTAGAAGFIAGAIMLSGGVIALSRLL